jgi:hypothetical protein
MDVKGDSAEIVGGKKKVEITGKSASPTAASDPVLNMELGTSPQGSLKIKAASKFEVQAIGNSIIDSSGLTLSAKGPTKLTGAAIYLN